MEEDIDVSVNKIKAIMILIKSSFLTSLVFIVSATWGQQTLPIPRNIQKTYINQTRSADGKPGNKYWQNTANYLINVNFYPDSRQLIGTVTIDYTNNSPDTLKEIWFKLYPNLYKKGSPHQQQIDPIDESDGIHINNITINGKTKNVSSLNTEIGRKSNSPSMAFAKDATSFKLDGTNMKVTIEPLAPKQTIHFIIDYNYTLNKGSHIRTGEIDMGSDFVAYFFPRIAVYDDIDGWNKIPYTGMLEFYNDFCHFKANITVPKNYIVWATGTLLNSQEVLQEKYVQKIAQAEQNNDITTIIDTTDLQQGNITTNNPANTWQFKADNVTDFVFATSNHYIWKASSLVVDKKTNRRTRVDAAFKPIHKDYFEVINYARKTVEAMSYTFPAWPYPYEHETVFDGLDQMEYPMMVNDNPLEDREDAITLTDHEIFHTMFPFYMGINETKYGWMDEGWATIGEWLISNIIDSSIIDDYGVESYGNIAGKEEDIPIMSLSTQQSTNSYFINTYPRPALGYLYVKDMLGDELFTKALHYYIEQWHGKHPMPYDFFNCMNTGSGKNLNWFWKRWFFDNGFPDLAITKVINNKNNYIVLITSIGTKPVPIDLTIFYTDGTKQNMHRRISVWENSTSTTLTFSANKTVEKFILGSVYVPDINKADNVYEVKH